MESRQHWKWERNVNSGWGWWNSGKSICQSRGSPRFKKRWRGSLITTKETIDVLNARSSRPGYHVEGFRFSAIGKPSEKSAFSGKEDDGLQLVGNVQQLHFFGLICTQAPLLIMDFSQPLQREPLGPERRGHQNSTAFSHVSHSRVARIRRVLCRPVTRLF